MIPMESGKLVALFATSHVGYGFQVLVWYTNDGQGGNFWWISSIAALDDIDWWVRIDGTASGSL